MKRKIDEVFKEFSFRDGPGVAVTIIKDGEKKYENYFGYANLDHKIKISKNTVFDTGSLSKHFLGYGIGKLVLKGLVSLEDTLDKYFDNIEILKDINVNHVLRHTSGLYNYSPFENYIGNITCESDIFRILKTQTKLSFIAGNEFRYCNTGYTILAKIIELISIQKFENWMQDNIFMEKNMQHTFVLKDYRKVIDHLSTPYKKVGETYEKAIRNYSVGASAIHSTIEDIRKWLIYLDTMHQNDQTFAKLLFTKGKLNDGRDIYYGFGSFIGDYKGSKIIEHGGECEGYRSALSFSPDLRIGIGILSNDSSIDIWEKVRKIYQIYTETDNQKTDNTANQISEWVQKTEVNLNVFEGRYLIEHYKGKGGIGV